MPGAGLGVEVLDEPRSLQSLLHVTVIVEHAHAPSVGGHGLPAFCEVIVTNVDVVDLDDLKNGLIIYLKSLSKAGRNGMSLHI